jgi:hypothetical protein
MGSPKPVGVFEEHPALLQCPKCSRDMLRRVRRGPLERILFTEAYSCLACRHRARVARPAFRQLSSFKAPRVRRPSENVDTTTVDGPRDRSSAKP